MPKTLLKAYEVPQRSRRRLRRRSVQAEANRHDSETDSETSYTFNLQRIHPAAHRFQRLETEQLISAATEVRKQCTDEQMKVYLKSPTTYLRRWARFHRSHRTGREELQLWEHLQEGREVSIYDEEDVLLSDLAVTLLDDAENITIAQLKLDMDDDKPLVTPYSSQPDWDP